MNTRILIFTIFLTLIIGSSVYSQDFFSHSLASTTVPLSPHSQTTEIIPPQRLMKIIEMEKEYDKKNKTYFIQLLDNSDFVIRCRALSILEDMKGDDIVPHIAKVLKSDPNSLVRHEAAFALGQLSNLSGREALENATKNDPSTFVRHEAAVALGVLGSKKSLATLQGALKDTSEDVRASAMIALSALKFAEYDCENDPSFANFNIPRTRLAKFSEMEKKFSQKEKEYFITLLEDEDFVIRCKAVCIMVELGSSDDVRQIARVMKQDSNELVRHEAAFTLGQISDESGVLYLVEALNNDPSLFVRHESAIALGVIGSQKAKKALYLALNDPSEDVRDSAVVALSNLKFLETVSRSKKFARLIGG